VASIVIGQVGGTCSVLVDNVIRRLQAGAPALFLVTIGKHFRRKFGAQRRHFQFCPAWI